MDPIKLRVTNGLLDDGTTWRNVPITPGDDVAFEKSARVNGWGGVDTSTMTAQAFLCWYASKRAGHHSLTWDEFQQRAIFAEVELTELDPTQLIKPPAGETSPLGLTAAGTTPPVS